MATDDAAPAAPSKKPPVAPVAQSSKVTDPGAGTVQSQTIPQNSVAVPTPITTQSPAAGQGQIPAKSSEAQSSSRSQSALSSSGSSSASASAARASTVSSQPSRGTSNGSNTGLIAGIAVLAVLLAIALAAVAFLIFRNKREHTHKVLL